MAPFDVGIGCRMQVIIAAHRKSGTYEAGKLLGR